MPKQSPACVTLLPAPLARGAVAAAPAASLSLAGGVAFAAEFLLERSSALGAVWIFAVALYKLFAFIPALGANKFYKSHISPLKRNVRLGV